MDSHAQDTDPFADVQPCSSKGIPKLRTDMKYLPSTRCSGSGPKPQRQLLVCGSAGRNNPSSFAAQTGSLRSDDIGMRWTLNRCTQKGKTQDRPPARSPS